MGFVGLIPEIIYITDTFYLIVRQCPVENSQTTYKSFEEIAIFLMMN